MRYEITLEKRAVGAAAEGTAGLAARQNRRSTRAPVRIELRALAGDPIWLAEYWPGASQREQKLQGLRAAQERRFIAAIRQGIVYINVDQQEHLFAAKAGSAGNYDDSRGRAYRM